MNHSNQDEPDTPPIRRAPDGTALSAPKSKRQAQPGKSRPVKPRNTPNTRKCPSNETRLNPVAHGTHGTGRNRVAVPSPPQLRGQRLAGLVKRKKGFTRWRGGRGDQARQTSALSAPPREPVSPKRTAYSAAPTCSGARRDPIDGSEPSRSPTEHTEDTEPDGIGSPFPPPVAASASEWRSRETKERFHAVARRTRGTSPPNRRALRASA